MSFARAAPASLAERELSALVEWFARGRVAVLTGAGVSTESGIPDYRGPETRRRARNPVQYRDFLRSPSARKRYWARSLIGWPRFNAARPSLPHLALARLEGAGMLSGLITQNVDGLHGDAGNRELVELHGNLREVLCLGCGQRGPRAALQAELERANPGFVEQLAELLPDGDAELPDAALRDFQLIACAHCGGDLKPHVVFFGENVPPPRVERAFELVHAARALLIVGSSLTVYSGYRFARAARERALPLAIVNLGPTRADPLSDLRIEARAGDLLSRLADALSA